MHALDCRHAALCWILCPLPFLRAMADSADRATVWSTAFRSSFGQGQALDWLTPKLLAQAADQVRVNPSCEPAPLPAQPMSLIVPFHPSPCRSNRAHEALSP